MIDFLYFGEANVYQENLDSFLAVAEELQLKGLMGSGAEEEAEKSNSKPQLKKKTKRPSQHQKYSQQETSTFNSSLVDQPSSVDRIESSSPLEGIVAVTDYTVAADLQDLDDKIKSMMEVGEKQLT